MPNFLTNLFQRRKKYVPAERPACSGCTYSLGVALSAGGARGLAHVGFLQVLEENEIQIQAIAGSSMGAYVGALWAAGFSGDDLYELAAEMHDKRQLWKLADFIIPPVKGLVKGVKAREHLRKSIGDVKFEELSRELYLVTFDVNTRERIVLRHGSIVEAVHASCAIPGIVAPVKINGRSCADGGVVDPVPISTLRKYSSAEKIIAVSVVPTYEDLETGATERPPPPPTKNPFKIAFRAVRQTFDYAAQGNAVDTLRQSVSAAQIRIAHESLKEADLAILPDCRTARWFEYSHFENFIEAGREAAIAALPEIRAMLGAPKHKHSAKHETFPDLVGDGVA